MSNKEVALEQEMNGIGGSHSPNFAKIVRHWQINMMIGRIMLVIETMGLNENQLEASKNLIKQMIWSEYNEGIYISDKMSEAVAKENEAEGFYNRTS